MRPSLTMDRRFLMEGAEILLVDGEGPGDAKKKIQGYAAVFNAEAEIMPGFREIVRPGAFTRTLRQADIRALLNHDPNFVLGRNKAGTLKLWEDDKGLGYRIDPPATSFANDLLESIGRGDVSQSSFGFRVVKDRWTEGLEKKTLMRELLEVKLYDVSPVTFAAYAQTEVHVRGLVDSLLLKQQASAEIDDDERRAVLAALDLLKDFFTPDPALRHSGHSTEDPAPSQDGRHSSGDDGRDPADLRRRLELLAQEVL
jgi:hypothetical protein